MGEMAEEAEVPKIIDQSQQQVTGTARVKLFKGHVRTVGRKAAKSLYNPDFATFEADTVYDQQDAEGFIKLNALRLRLRGMVQRS